MGGKSSKRAARQSSLGESTRTVDQLAAARGKSERQENEEARAKRVGMLCRWITECTVESEMEDFLGQMRQLCGEMTAKLYTQTDLQTALLADAETVVYATAKAMLQYPDNDRITISSLEIFQFMEMSGWDGKRGASQQAEQVMRVMGSILEKNQENSSGFTAEDLEKLKLCVEIVKGMIVHHREELSKTECAQILLKTLKAVPKPSRNQFSTIGFLLAEKLSTSKDGSDQVIQLVLDLMIEDGLTVCEVAKRRWSDAEDDDFVSPLLREMTINKRVPVDAQCSVSGKTALIAACETNQRGTARFLLDNCAALELADNQGRTPLMAAVAEGHLDCVKLLLSKGARIDRIDADKCNPLHLAVGRNDEAIVSEILGRCDENNKQEIVNAVNGVGLTPLLASVWHKSDEDMSIRVLKLLLQHGGNVNLLASNGASALILAVHKRRNLDTLRVIIDAGCSKALKCQDLTAYDVAVEEGADEAECELLRV